MKKLIIVIICLIILALSVIGCLPSQSDADKANDAPYSIEQVHHRINFNDTFYFSDNYSISDGTLTLHGYWDAALIRQYHKTDLTLNGNWSIVEIVEVEIGQ